MTDPFTAACPLYRNAQRGAVKSGAAFEWTGKGSWFRLPFGRPSGAA